MNKSCNCWSGYVKVSGKEPCSKNSCRKKKGKKKKFRNFSEGISKSNKPGKKWKKKVNGKTYHAGDSNYKISPGTSRGDSYCARSLGIKRKHGSTPKNEMARKKWKCSGAKSRK